MAELTFIVAFVAGVLSFLSPCVLPLVPAYLTFIAGTSIREVQQDVPGTRMRIFVSSVLFVLGFSVVFSILGVLLQSALSGIAYDLRTYLNYIGGAIIIFFGLFLMGLVKIDFLQREHKLDVKGAEKFKYIGSFVFGAAFAVGWTPCVGAVLGGVLTLAATRPEAAFPLMVSYTLGLGIPFILAGAFISQATGLIKKAGPYIGTLNIIFGIVLVILGILVVTDSLYIVANLFPVQQFISSG